MTQMDGLLHAMRHWSVTGSFRDTMPYQPAPKVISSASLCPADTVVFQQGLSRAFPLTNDGSFDELLIAIDIADERAKAATVGIPK
jgi:hypothetical protein